ncbi:MAG: hypothetical protein QNK31_12040, partial [Porticoccus sp.]|nr:hypothetical protein [Porticoccus sp.]
KRRGLPELDYHGFRLGLQIFIIFNIISLTRLLFRGGSVEGAVEYGQAMLNFNNSSLPLDFVGFSVLLIAVIAHYTPDRWTFGWKGLYCRLPSMVQGGLMVATVFLLVAISSGEAPFIYFQF